MINNSQKENILLSIGDIGISINWEGSTVLDWPAKIYDGFTKPDNIDINLFIKCGPLPDYKKGQLVFDADGNWKLYQTNDGYIIEEFDTLTKKKDRLIILNSKYDRGDVFMTPDEVEKWENFLFKITNRNSIRWSIHRLIDPFIKILTANRLIQKNGVLVHGLSVLDQGKGILFLGRSGAGKSTLANFYKGTKGACVINDEKTILLKKDGKFFIYGTPWPGDALIANPIKTLLDEVYFIKHNRENELFSLPAAETFNHFFSQFFLPFWDQDSIIRSMGLLEGLLSVKKPKEFGFVRDKSAVDFIRRNYGTEKKV